MKEKNIFVFSNDIRENEGYYYTNTNKLSCKLAINRATEAIYSMLGDIKRKRIIDIGCGDGSLTKDLLMLKPSHIMGIDPNRAGIELAKKYEIYQNISFEAMDIYNLSLEQRYDICILRGVLHHLYHVERAIERVCKIADRIIVLEPNGYNPILKLIEKFSPYHIKHEEKSYFPRKLDKWFKSNGGYIIKSVYINLVPMFCPDLLARMVKFLEPFVEGIPIFRNIACGQYVQVIQMSKELSRK